MNIKNSKGITLSVLIITIVILIILAGVVISFGVNISGTAKFENVQTYLLLIQSKCKIKSEMKAMGEIGEEELYGTKQTEGEYNGWYLLSQGDLNDIGLKGVKAEDKYYVDYENEDVVYGKGLQYEERTFYKLSEILEYTGK